MTHQLKILPEFYNLVALGVKSWELRKNDRNYQIGDILVLNEIQPGNKTDLFPNDIYTGRKISVSVFHVFDKTEFGLNQGYVILSFVLRE
jgi:hypothetical protein